MAEYFEYIIKVLATQIIPPPNNADENRIGFFDKGMNSKTMPYAPIIVAIEAIWL